MNRRIPFTHVVYSWGHWLTARRKWVLFPDRTCWNVREAAEVEAERQPGAITMEVSA